MKNLRNTTSKAVKKENSTKKVLNRMEGITLIALVITVIVMLILAGVSISALMGNEGLFARTASAADAYKQAAEKENADIESLINELDDALKGLEKTEPKPITELAKNGTLKVGDYIDYDAGVWTQDDLDKITSSTDNPTLHITVYDEVKNNQANPTEGGQFGGFELGQSKNDNSTTYYSSHPPKTSGWRIWDIDDNGKVTIIHAGHPEMYFYIRDDSGRLTKLTKRNYSMYENEYAVAGSAQILDLTEAVEWHNKKFGTNWVPGKPPLIFSREKDDLLINGAYYWVPYTPLEAQMWYATEIGVGCADAKAMGIRPLVSLKSDFKLELDTNKTEDGWNLWKIVKE